MKPSIHTFWLLKLLNGGTQDEQRQGDRHERHADEDRQRAMPLREGAQAVPRRCLASVPWRAWCPASWRSCPLSNLLAEQAGRPEDEHDDEDHEHERPRAQREQAERGRGDLDEADDEAAERGAGDVADAAEDGRGERLEAGLEAEVELDVAEVEALDDARRAGQAPTR